MRKTGLLRKAGNALFFLHFLWIGTLGTSYAVYANHRLSESRQPDTVFLQDVEGHQSGESATVQRCILIACLITPIAAIANEIHWYLNTGSKTQNDPRFN
jgi:hypothetical protein